MSRLSLLLLAVCGTASATTMTQLDLAGLTARAESVVAGRVTEARAAWTADHSAIYTDVTILVDRALAGAAQPGQQVVVRREGGTVDGLAMKVYGAATFTKGEDVVVFVERRNGARYVVGMAQGKLSLYTDGSGARRLQRDLSELSFLPPAGGAARPFSARSVTTLDELAAEVQRLRRAPRNAP